MPGSLLRALWPAAHAEVAAARSDAAPARAQPEGPQWFEVPLRRLAANWESPLGDARPDWTATHREDAAAPTEGDASWLRAAGTVAHRWLEEIARAGSALCDSGDIENLRPTICSQLQRLATPADRLEAAADRVCVALTACLDDEQARWLLSPAHSDAASEFAIAQLNAAGELEELRLDRTFVDGDGQRWIVDFKISEPAPGQADAEFVAEQRRRYRAQLSGYRDAIAKLDPQPRPVRAALYLPLLPALVDVPLDDKPPSE